MKGIQLIPFSSAASLVAVVIRPIAVFRLSTTILSPVRSLMIMCLATQSRRVFKIEAASSLTSYGAKGEMSRVIILLAGNMCALQKVETNLCWCDQKLADLSMLLCPKHKSLLLGIRIDTIE